MHECKQEQRLKHLEESNFEHTWQIKTLIAKLDSLINVLTKLVWISIPVFVGMLGFLIVYWVKG
jgi:hypothetical protein